MPLDSEKLDELKSNIAFARKRPLAFGLCLGKAAETTVLLSHKTKDPETVGRLAKKEGETTKLAFGFMTVEGKNLNLACHGDLIPGLARKTREMLKALGMKMKVRILDAEGNLLEENADPEDEANTDGGPPADAGTPDPEKEKWDQTRPRVEEALARAAADGMLDVKQAQASWQGALASAQADDFAAALKAAAAVAQQIGAAVQARAAAEADRARWLAAADRLAPIVDGLVTAATPEARKLAAYWSFAQSRARASVPDYPAVMKTLPLIVKLVNELRAKGLGSPQTGQGAATAAASGPGGGAPPVNADENARLASLSDEDLMKTDLTLGDTKALFSKDYMLKLKDAPIKGEGDRDLKKLMSEIAKGLSGPRRGEVMQALARIVGVPPTPEKLDDDYGRFLVIKKQQEAKAKAKKKEEVPGLDEKKHTDFMASRGQLMFGKVLADAFGIHEVFAALLSPTGGLVGAGNDSVHLSPDNPVAIHGTVHDAAGYLASYHDEGPGYNYRENAIESLIFANFDIPDYLAGQVSGIDFWLDEAGKGKGVAYWIKESAKDIGKQELKKAVAAVEKKLKPIVKKVETEIDQKIDEAKKLAAKGAEKVGKMADAARDKAIGVLDAIRGAPAKVEKAAVETIDETKKKLGEMKEDAKRKLEAAFDFIW